MNGHIHPGQKPDASENNKSHNGNVDNRVTGEGWQGGLCLCAAHKIKTCITESGDGVEYRKPDALG